MIIRVARDTWTLDEPTDFGGFHVSSLDPDPAVVAATIGQGAAPVGDGRHVWIPIAAVLSVAPADPTWRVDFDKMLAYADEKGWLDADQTAIQAHIET